MSKPIDIIHHISIQVKSTDSVYIKDACRNNVEMLTLPSEDEAA